MPVWVWTPKACRTKRTNCIGSSSGRSHWFSRTKRRARPFFLQSRAICSAASKRRLSLSQREKLRPSHLFSFFSAIASARLNGEITNTGRQDPTVHICWGTNDGGTIRWLLDVWGSAANDVFAVGNAGAILHYNGSAWSLLVGWSHDENLGTKGVGTFYTDISGLSPGTTYYYRCRAYTLCLLGGYLESAPGVPP